MFVYCKHAQTLAAVIMLRDLILGAVLGGFIWRWWAKNLSTEILGPPVIKGLLSAVPPPAGIPAPQEELSQMQRQLAQVQQDLQQELETRIDHETKIMELNQLATDRAIELVQLRTENAALVSRVQSLQQKRQRKKSPANPATSVSQSPSAQTPTLTAIPETVLPPIQALEPEGQPAFHLNLDLIQQKQAESAAVSQLLSPIFVEPEPEGLDRPAAIVSEGTAASELSSPVLPPLMTGLDKAHAAFFYDLRQQQIWPRIALEAIAQKHGILLDGALELINERALEQCDDTLTEGDDPIELHPDILQELLS